MDARAIYPTTQAHESKLPVENTGSGPYGPQSSAQMPQRAPHGLVIALVGKFAARARGRLQQLGHLHVVFARAFDLLSALKGGQQFDLVLLSLEDGVEVFGNGILATFKAFGVPILLFVQEGKWDGLFSQVESLARCEVLGFDNARTTNEELDWRIRVAYQRIRDVVQRTYLPAARTRFGDYQFLSAHRSVMYRDREILLKPREYEFALELFRNLGRVLTRDQLWSSLWKTALRFNGARVIDVCASSLRNKLQLRGENGVVLRAVYGQGYKLELADSFIMKDLQDIAF